MNNHYGVSQFNIATSPTMLDVYLYDTLDTVQQNIPVQSCVDGVPPIAIINHHLFTSLRGIMLSEPGDFLHMKDGSVIKTFKYVVLVDRFFFMMLKKKELEAIVTREEVLWRHIINTGNTHALKNPREYYVTHDTLTCHHGVNAMDLHSAIRQSKKFECDITSRIFKMDGFDRVMLRLMYFVQCFNSHHRIRNKNLRMLHKKAPLKLVTNRDIDVEKRIA